MDLHQYPLLLSGSLDCKIEALLVDVEPSIAPIQSRLGCPQDEMELHHTHLPPSSVANFDPVGRKLQVHDGCKKALGEAHPYTCGSTAGRYSLAS